ncbi:MAG TPA: CHAP domain-containing protein [Acidimicrobiales bacterium]|nr:CHAP domain-containing protein [Acidimicrobiales bacterium]
MSRTDALARRARMAGRHPRPPAASAAAVLAAALGALSLLPGAPAAASTRSARPAGASGRPLATSAAWCSTHGSGLGGWTGTSPNLPICGPGPDYGGTWQYVDLPGPGGAPAGFYNATPGFQCVELAERWLAVADGFAPQHAEGSLVAAVYHAAFPRSTLVVDGSPGAVGHPPVRGDVISFSLVPSFEDPSDGHVAIVVRSSVDPFSGNGSVLVAQQNVSSSDYLMTLDVVGWRLEDPQEPGNAEFQFPYAEWLHVLPTPTEAALARRLQLDQLARERADSPALVLTVPASMARRPRSRRRTAELAGAPASGEARLVDFVAAMPGPRVAAARGERDLPGVGLARTASRSGGGPQGFPPVAALGCAVLLVLLARRRLLPGGRGPVSSR